MTARASVLALLSAACLAAACGDDNTPASPTPTPPASAATVSVVATPVPLVAVPDPSGTGEMYRVTANLSFQETGGKAARITALQVTVSSTATPDWRSIGANRGVDFRRRPRLRRLHAADDVRGGSAGPGSPMGAGRDGGGRRRRRRQGGADSGTVDRSPSARCRCGLRRRRRRGWMRPPRARGHGQSAGPDPGHGLRGGRRHVSLGHDGELHELLRADVGTSPVRGPSRCPATTTTSRMAGRRSSRTSGPRPARPGSATTPTRWAPGTSSCSTAPCPPRPARRSTSG